MTRQQITSIVRSVLKVGSGFVIGAGWADEAMTGEIVGGIMALLGVIWGVVEKKD